MGDKECTIRDYLDKKGLQKDLSGYYFLESAISYSIANPTMKCQGIFQKMIDEGKLDCSLDSVYSASAYVLKQAKADTTVKRFVRLAADNIVREMSMNGKGGTNTCH